MSEPASDPARCETCGSDDPNECHMAIPGEPDRHKGHPHSFAGGVTKACCQDAFHFRPASDPAVSPSEGEERCPVCWRDDCPCRESERDQLQQELGTLIAAFDKAQDADAWQGEGKQDGYGSFACGCSWDSGPYPIHCEKHDPDRFLAKAVNQARKALSSSPDTEEVA